ncbi:MAG: hypothetical protein IPM93_12075 [Candidatus Obscuribacter sp.]|nr:hypothetical protein [Candidatus Obscuribacter sp.]
MLERLLRYADKQLHFGELVTGVRDLRRWSHVPTADVVTAVLDMFFARLGSLNALEKLNHLPAWKKLPPAQSVPIPSDVLWMFSMMALCALPRRCSTLP